MSIAYEVLGVKRCARSGAEFERDLKKFSIAEKIMILIFYLLPILIPSTAKSIDTLTNLVFPLSMGLSTFSFMPIATRAARRFFDSDVVRIVTLHSLIVTIYILMVFASSLRVSNIFYSDNFLESSGSSGEMAYRMVILISYLFYESGRLINRSKGLCKRFVVVSQLAGALLTGVSAVVCRMGLIPDSLLHQLFFCCGVVSIIMSLALDSFPSMITLKKDLDILPLIGAGGCLFNAFLGTYMILPSLPLNQ
ncbi:uncharacterized protein Eint_051000 [Encephalitozoon intestinalis ATCC 50506]|uniref:Uncharacterized protein n=1 Tax=Encephalitozoon intestinalis (strain ATCC 50506) TaxID=876142 RepID=E0S7B9_ENCIT|nr:uncharacterized protein Eint_051000 [Encephalitozoon intestinalis ATCC 50506]ADM11547.1 hypothetical protein Eint_051000 [Encephalitozoon intestinalis ATCC 50506]UTX45261.1 hypothetical protein GPK93_05g08070 [Encephalitozoon intestinalis]